MGILFTGPPFPCFMAAGEDWYAPGDSHPNRSNLGIFDMLIVTEGALYIGEEDQQWELHEGSVLILKPDKHHYTYRPCLENTHFYFIHFHSLGIWSEGSEGAWTAHRHPYYREFEIQEEDDRLNIKSSSLLLSPYYRFSHPQNVYAIARQLLQLELQPQSAARWQQQMLFHQLISELHASGTHEKESITHRIAEKAAGYLRKHFNEPISYRTIKEELRFNPTYISRCMKQAYGMTLTEYLIYYRIERAAILLIKTDLPVSQVAEQVGFMNVSYFARKFMKQKNVNPSGFRKKYIT